MTREEFRLKNIEANLRELKRAFKEILPLHSFVDRQKKALELNISGLEEQIVKIKQGQLELKDEYDQRDPDYDESMGF